MNVFEYRPAFSITFVNRIFLNTIHKIVCGLWIILKAHKKGLMQQLFPAPFDSAQGSEAEADGVIERSRNDTQTKEIVQD